MTHIRIDGRTFLENILACSLTGTDGIVLCKHGGTGGPYFHIIDMGGNNTDAACAFMGSNVFVIGLTWNSPERLWLANKAPSFDAINFRPLRLPFSINDLMEVIRDMHGAWTPIYCHAGMNLWQFTIDVINNTALHTNSDIPRKAILKIYPALKSCANATEIAEKLSLHTAFSLHREMAHRNERDGLEGFLADIASFAADAAASSKSATEMDCSKKLLITGLKKQLVEFERLTFYFKELAMVPCSDNRTGEFINKLVMKQAGLHDSLKSLIRIMTDRQHNWKLLTEDTIKSIQYLKELLVLREEIKEML